MKPSIESRNDSAKEKRNLDEITLTMNGKKISARPGSSLLDAATENGVRIPTLCHHRYLAPAGACRICLVEDEKSGRTMASCVTPVSPDMVIQTADTPSALLLYQAAQRHRVPLVNGYCNNGRCFVQVFDYRNSACKTFVERMKDSIKWKNIRPIAEMSDGTRVTAHLCRQLIPLADTIGLNVKSDNLGAIHCYRKLGFERHAVYGEFMIEGEA